MTQHQYLDMDKLVEYNKENNPAFGGKGLDAQEKVRDAIQIVCVQDKAYAASILVTSPTAQCHHLCIKIHALTSSVLMERSVLWMATEEYAFVPLGALIIVLNAFVAQMALLIRQFVI